MLTLLLCCLPSADMEAQKRQRFLDPLSAAAAAAEDEGASANSPDKPARVEASQSGIKDSPTLSISRQAADGSEDVETAADKNDQTDSSSAWSPEVLQPDISDILCYLV